MRRESSQPDLLEALQVQTQCSSKAGLQEQASYFEVPGAHFYTVLHPVMDPVARVLLVGPFAAGIKDLVARFNLSGVVIVGHCSGTASAIYTGAVSKERKGLVLMDPYFHLQQIKLPKFRRQIHTWALQVHLDGLLSKIYDQAKGFFLFFRGSALPENANFAPSQLEGSGICRSANSHPQVAGAAGSGHEDEGR